MRIWEYFIIRNIRSNKIIWTKNRCFSKEFGHVILLVEFMRFKNIFL